MPVLLYPRLDRADEGPGYPLVLTLARRVTGVDETQGLWKDPCLAVAFLLRCPGNFHLELGKHAVYPVRGLRRPDGEACVIPKLA